MQQRLAGLISAVRALSRVELNLPPELTPIPPPSLPTDGSGNVLSCASVLAELLRDGELAAAPGGSVGPAASTVAADSSAALSMGGRTTIAGGGVGGSSMTAVAAAVLSSAAESALGSPLKLLTLAGAGGRAQPSRSSRESGAGGRPTPASLSAAPGSEQAATAAARALRQRRRRRPLALFRSQLEHKMKRALLLNVIVTQRPAILWNAHRRSHIKEDKKTIYELEYNYEKHK